MSPNQLPNKMSQMGSTDTSPMKITNGSKYLSIRSEYLALREIQIKTTVRFIPNPVRMATIKKRE